MTLTDHQEMIRQTVRRFAESEIAPVAAEYDARERFHAELVPRFAAVGLLDAPWNARATSGPLGEEVPRKWFVVLLSGH